MTVTKVGAVTARTWEDFVRLFTASGAPHYCFCTTYRASGNDRPTGEQRRQAMLALVAGGVPIGVLAYDGDDPIGWCSIAPREAYARLARSRTMPRATAAETSTWTVLCFFVPRPRRRQGVARALLDGAVAYARDGGAEIVEGYPFDSAGVSSTHRGHSSVFAAAGFVQDGHRWHRGV